MTYATNLTDSTKNSAYLITMDLVLIIESSQFVNPGTVDAYVEYPYGEPLRVGTFFNSTQLRPTLETATLLNNDNDVRNNIAFTWNAAQKRLEFNDTGYDRIATKFRVYLSTDIMRTYKDPTDDATEVVSWDTTIISPPTVLREASDFVIGFLPTQVSSFTVAASDERFNLSVYGMDANSAPFVLYHVVGDPSDASNAKKIFEGRVSDYSYNFEEIEFQVSDPTSDFDAKLIHPDNEQDYSSTSSLSIATAQLGFSQRRIYGAVNNVLALNVDRPADPDNPLTTENRNWVFALYDGDNAKIPDVTITKADSNTEVEFDTQDVGGEFTDGIYIYRFFPSGFTDQNILDAINSVRISNLDRIKVTTDAYPGETFHFEVRQIEGKLEDSNNIIGSSEDAAFFRIRITDMTGLVSAQTGDSKFDVQVKLRAATTITVERPVVPRLSLRDNEGNNYLLEYDTHYTTFRDSVNKLYGITLTNNVESLISGFPYAALTGAERVFARVYGPKPDTSTVAYESVPNMSASFGSPQSDFSNSGTTNTAVSVIYSYFKDYMNLEDSQIDLDKFNSVAAQDPWRIENDGGFKKVVGHQSEYTFANTNVIFPPQIGADQRSVKEQLIEILKPMFVQVFINNDAKWSFDSYLFSSDRSAVKTLNANDFEVVSGETFMNADLYGIVKVNDNFVEASAVEDVDGQYLTGFWVSERGYMANHSLRQAELVSDYHSSFVTETNASSFITNEVSSLTSGGWASGYVTAYSSRISTTSIRVGREHFDLDLFDPITINSKFVSGGLNSEVSRKYVIVGIEQFIDFRVLKISDVIIFNETSPAGDPPFTGVSFTTNVSV